MGGYHRLQYVVVLMRAGCVSHRKALKQTHDEKQRHQFRFYSDYLYTNSNRLITNFLRNQRQEICDPNIFTGLRK